MHRHKKRGCLSFLFRIALLFAVLAVLFNAVFRFILVDGESMNPTYETGNWIVACKLVKPERGDIILTNTKNAYKVRIIKRVIALGGDTVDIDFDSGTVFVNGEAVDEPYTLDVPCVRGTVSFPLTVPEGKVFLLGDNRSNSIDSRYAEIGCVDEQNIFGTVILKLWPVSEE